jgi:hypothetical protein
MNGQIGSLTGLVRGKLDQPRRTLLYAPEGVGKSTFASRAHAPIFICAEDGTAQLDVVRLPTPKEWKDVLGSITALTTNKHDFRTLVVDTLDWIEPMLWQHICQRDRKDNVEAYGYGRGYTAALDEWRLFVSALERLRRETRMEVILLAHAWIKAFKDPESDGYDRYELKLHNKAAGLLKEWCDSVLFANYETLQAKDERTKRVRGVSSGARIIHTGRTAAFDAKSRFGLPATLPLDFAEYDAACRASQPADPVTLAEEIRARAPSLGDVLEKQALGALDRAQGDAMKLAELSNWVAAKLAVATQSTPTTRSPRRAES